MWNNLAESLTVDFLTLTVELQKIAHLAIFGQHFLLNVLLHMFQTSVDYLQSPIFCNIIKIECSSLRAVTSAQNICDSNQAASKNLHFPKLAYTGSYLNGNQPQIQAIYWAAREGNAQSQNGGRLICAAKRQNGGQNYQKAVRVPFLFNGAEIC